MQQLPQNNLLTPRTGILIAMIAFAVGVRLLISFVPGIFPYNFTPVEAIALFGGAYFVDRRLAFIVPLAAMFLADLVIGLHPLIPVIYACIAGSVLLGFGLRDKVNVLRVAGYGVAGSIMFFAVVSFVEWLIGDTDYCRAGIVSCYTAALPFLKNWLAGTLVWSGILFGGFELMRKRWVWIRRPRNNGAMGNRLSKIYTKTGDDGTTGLGDGTRVAKDSARVGAYGTVDELNSTIGMVLAQDIPAACREALIQIQHDLFDLGGELCIPGMVMVHDADIDRLEATLDGFNADLPALKDFILPGGGIAAACCHVARTVCRRAEREVVALSRTESVRSEAIRYLNRLSDMLFVLARVLARASGHGEVLWQHERRKKQQP